MKYIIESNDVIGYTPKYAMLFGDGYMIQPLEDLEELNSDYINEHFSDLQDTAYRKGLEDGKKATWGLVADASGAEYQRGLDDAWEAARKIVEMSDPPYWELFDEYKENLFGKISASEAIEKLKAYEEKQKADDEIKVGDEVEVKERGIKFFVTKIYEADGTVGGLNKDGEVRYWSLNLVKRTGRHFDIMKMLKEMRT